MDVAARPRTSARGRSVVATLSKRKLQESQGRWLKLVSGMAILLIGIIMLLKPQWLH